MNATVIYPNQRTFEIPIEAGKEMFIDTALKCVWEECQGGIEEIIGRPTELDKLNAKGARLRSSMVGDIIAIHGRYFIVNSIGFVEVSMEVAEIWQSIPNRDVVMGWEWCRQHHNVGLHIDIIK